MTGMSPRAFAINTIPLEQHRFTFVSLDDERYFGNPEICPPDRLTRVSGVMDEVDLTVFEYFPPELEETAYSVPVLGSLIRKCGPSLDYDKLAQLAHAKGQRAGVADIANKLRYAHMGLALPFYCIEHGTGTRMVLPRQLERYFATPTDARRMLTAEAIKQEADRHPDGTHLAYIGAPAHVNRVAHYITQELTWLDRARLTCYHNNLSGLDKALRIYEPDGEQWALTERHDIVPRPMGALATLSARISSL